MKIIDLKKDLKHLYRPSAKEIVEVDVPSMTFLMIDGKGDPNSSSCYQEAIEALFSVSYTIKFMAKRGDLGIDYGVMPLEGLWWADDMSKFSVEDKSNWKWTAMIMQPSFITHEMMEQAMLEVKKKKNPAALSKIRIEEYTEGRSAQILHIGPFTEEGPVIEKMHQYILSRGKPQGKHHEIYLSDIRKTDASKWRTILRQPMAASN